MAPLVDDVLRSPGRPLDTAARASMEPRFGHDFGHVRIHADARAAQAAEALNARAFTVGASIVFGRNEYDAGSERGRFVLAHELAHVVQQGGARDASASGLRVHPAGDAWEPEADRAAGDALRGGAAGADGARTESKRGAGAAGQPAAWRSSLAAPASGAIQRLPCNETTRQDHPNHTLIQAWYKLSFPGHHLLREYEIPNAGMNGTTGFADLVSTNRNEIWDIAHPSDHLNSKAAGVRVYAAQANTHCPAAQPWTVGISLPPQEIPPQRPIFSVQPVQPGILQYTTRDPDPARVLRGIRWVEERLRNPTAAPRTAVPAFDAVPVPADRGYAPGSGSDVSGVGDAAEAEVQWDPGWQPTARDREVGRLVRFTLGAIVVGAALAATLAAVLPEVAASVSVAEFAALLARLRVMAPAALQALGALTRSELAASLRQMARAAAH